MAKISRYTATDVAMKMATDVFKDRVSCIRKRIQEVAEKIAKREIPQEVLDICEKWKAYISVTHSISIQCMDNRGKTRCWVSSMTSFLLPFGSSSIVVTGEDSDNLYAYYDKLEQLRKSKNNLQIDIITILLDLGTTKRVEKEFPAAAPYFVAEEKKAEEASQPSKYGHLIKEIDAEIEKGKEH